MFTIEVKKKGRDEEFSFEDLVKSVKVFHEDCYRGKTVWKSETEKFRPGEGWFFSYARCGIRAKIEREKARGARLKIVQTAIDGEERKLSDDIRVVQKT